MSTRKNINKIKNIILRNTRKKRKSLKKVSIETEITKIQTEITKLRFEIKDIDKKIYSRKINKAFKRQLKNKQGVLLRKIKKLKAKLENQKYKRQFILASGRMTSQEEKKACTQNLKGVIKNDKCYMQTPFKTDCKPEERIIKNNPNNIRTITGNQFDRQVDLHENKVVYCPVDRILNQYGDEFEFVELVRSTRKAAAKKPVPKVITVLFRFSTPQTGRNYRFIYSSRNGSVPGLSNIIDPTQTLSSWRPSTTGAQFGSEAWRKNVNIQTRSKSSVINKRYPQVKYERQIGGPYARFKEKDARRWPKMPLWDDLQKKIVAMSKKIFKNDTMIEIPSATRPNDKERDKRFLIKDYKFVPTNWTGYLEKYQDASDYFKGSPYNFMIIALKNNLYAVVDVDLKGKMLTKTESRKEAERINQKRALLQEKNDELDQEIAKAQEMVKNAGDNKNKQRYAMKKLEKALEKKRKFNQQNSINENLSSINTGLGRSCDTHLEKIREILRDLSGYDPDDYGQYNDYEKARNNMLKIKYLRE
jgi:hypothetical protein